MAVLSSCRSSKPVNTSFYLIEYPWQANPTDTVIPLPFTLEIIDVDVHPVYSSTRIALREDAHQVSYFVNHVWAARPQQSLERFVMTYFNNNRFFYHTEKRFWNIQPDFKLFINVNNLEVVRDKKDFYARLHVEFRLETQSGEIVERHVTDNSRLLEKRNLNLFSQAINRMFFEELVFFTRKVYLVLKPAES